MKVYDDILIKGTLDGLSGASGDVLYHNGTSWVRLAPGSNGQVLTLASGIPSWAAAGGGGGSVAAAVIADVKTYNTDGGSCSSGAMRQRDLTTIITDPGSIISSLSGNDFTVAAGTYWIHWSCPAYQVGRFTSELYNATAGAAVKEGASMKASDSDYSMVRSEGAFIVTPGSSTAYRIRMRCDTTSSYGMGLAHGISGHDSIYTIATVFKLA